MKGDNPRPLAECSPRRLQLRDGHMAAVRGIPLIHPAIFTKAGVSTIVVGVADGPPFGPFSTPMLANPAHLRKHV